MKTEDSVGATQPQFLWNIEAQCPVCGSNMFIEEYIHNVPIIGRVILSSGECPKCKFTYRDTRMADSRGSQILKYRVKSLEDLGTIVVRAASASIKIPELQVSITPGAASQGFITTVEGVLLRVVEVMNFLKKDKDIDKKAWKERMDALKKALEGEMEFTLIIEDPEGVSRIVSNKEERLSMYR